VCLGKANYIVLPTENFFGGSLLRGLFKLTRSIRSKKVLGWAKQGGVNFGNPSISIVRGWPPILGVYPFDVNTPHSISGPIFMVKRGHLLKNTIRFAQTHIRFAQQSQNNFFSKSVPTGA